MCQAPNIAHATIRSYAAKSLIRKIKEGKMLFLVESKRQILPFFDRQIRAAWNLTTALKNEY
jgi:hypothetical protein